ncbi:MAG: OadG family protein [Eubacterium sp.]|nr:OadG family protein [Candidatus Colimonas fimequi]
MSLMEIFANPETMHSLSFGEKMLGSTITMIMGIGITFLVLCILWAFITIMGKAMNLAEKKPAPAPAAPAPVAEPEASDDADVIAAVIAAAVAAYQGAGGAKPLVVRKIVRVSGETTIWSNAARAEVIDSRKF